MMDKWDAERELRLNERADKAVSGFVHAVGNRLGLAEHAWRRALWSAAWERWRTCLEGLRPVDSVCAAVAARRPALCTFTTQRGGAARCRDLAAAARALERGGPLPEADGRLTPSLCIQGGILGTLFPFARGRCVGLVWREAIRTNEPAWCDALHEPSRRAACLAVYAAAPDLCPAPEAGEAGLLLDGRCREATLDSLLSPEVTEESGVVKLRFALLNAFPTPASCVAHVEVRTGGGVVSTTTGHFPLIPAVSAETVAVTQVALALRPAFPSDAVTVKVTCSWALEEPWYSDERDLMGLVAW